MEKQICSLIPEELLKQLKHLSAEKLVSVKSLLIEALRDLMVKHDNTRV